MLVYSKHTTSKFLKSLIDFFNLLVVIIFSLPYMVLFEFVDLLLNIIQLVLECFSLDHELLFDLIALLLKVGLLLVDVSLDLVSHLVGHNDLFDVFVRNFDVGLFLKHHKPFN